MPKGKKRKVQALVNKQEKNLIMNSSICDKNKKLKEVLSLFNGRIQKKDLPKIKNIDEEVYKIIKTRDAVEEMRDTASLEWVQKEYKGKIKIPCQLCGSKKSEEKFTIINRINKKELLVGTSCISKFPKMDNKLYGISIVQIPKLSKNNSKKLEKIVKFNDLYGSARDIFDNWKSKYNKFGIIFPKNYDDDFSNILKKSRGIYNSYINGRIDDARLKSFEICINDFNYRYKKCKKFYNDNKNNKYICTKEIANLLNNNELKTTLTYIQEKGKITKDIARNIYHIDFVERFKCDIENTFKKYNITLKSLNNQFISFFYEYRKFEPILLENSLKDFTYRFSNIFYGVNNFSQQYIFKGLTIKNTYSNSYNFLEILDDILKGSGYYFFINEELYGKQQIELNRKGFNSFAILDLKDILNNFNEVLYLNKVKSRTILLNYVENIHKWIDKSDKEKYDIGNIAEVWAK